MVIYATSFLVRFVCMVLFVVTFDQFILQLCTPTLSVCIWQWIVSSIVHIPKSVTVKLLHLFFIYMVCRRYIKRVQEFQCIYIYIYNIYVHVINFLLCLTLIFKNCLIYSVHVYGTLSSVPSPSVMTAVSSDRLIESLSASYRMIWLLILVFINFVKELMYSVCLFVCLYVC